MARALKTYTTSAGFFDLAIAAPSMKAALEAWGARSNLFGQGLAKRSDDPEIVRATLARPGVVLRRAVGSTGRFSEHAALPKDLPVTRTPRKPAARAAKQPATPDPAPARTSAMPTATGRAAEKARRDADRRALAAAEKRRRDVAAAEAALARAQRDHAARTAELDAMKAAEEARWQRERRTLEDALRRARSRKR